MARIACCVGADKILPAELATAPSTTRRRDPAQPASVFTRRSSRNYASGLIAVGCDVVTVQRALGHASASITLNTYSHLWPTAEDRTRAAATDLMRQVGVLLADSVRTDEH